MRRLVLLAPALLLLTGGSALAADFTFNVPVTLSNVPSVQSLRVECAVSRVAVDGGGAMVDLNVVGRGRATVRVEGGAYSGTVAVEVNASGFLTPDQARSYNCGMIAIGRHRTGVTYEVGPGTMQDLYERATGQRLTSVRGSVQGPIPR